MVVVAQMVRASDCGSEGYGFESRLPPKKKLDFKLIKRKRLPEEQESRSVTEEVRSKSVFH